MSAQFLRMKPFLWVDRVADICGRLSEAMVIAIAAMLTFEVVARYVFRAPTQWTQDVATTLQIWLTYLSMAVVLRHRQMIRITALLSIAPGAARYAMEALALIIIAVFSAIAMVKGYDMFADSIRLGRRQPTMLALPNWIAELPIMLGFGLLLVQSCADLLRLPFGPAPSFAHEGELDQSAIDGESGAPDKAPR
jgi:C4-dicarboxylate transporter DctQ subunit